MKTVIYGAGTYGKMICKYFENHNKAIEAFVDKKYNNLKEVDGIPVFSPDSIGSLIFDEIIISISKIAIAEEIKEDLINSGIGASKVTIFIKSELFYNVLTETNRYTENDIRVNWLKHFASFIYEQDIHGSVAECGVHRGEFAFFINKFFPDRKIYLFDTFEGFDNRDLCIELELKNEKFDKSIFNDKAFKLTNEKIAYDRMKYKNNCIIKKGYFPETTGDVNDIFCFVNLDMDLYKPMYEGLKFFYNRVSKGGIILMHDYFSPTLPGVKAAVEKFEEELEMNLSKVPIGDGSSIAVVK